MTPTEIIDRVASVAGIPRERITGPGRQRFAVWCRFICMEEITKACPWLTSAEVAGYVGRKDHGTALHAKAAYAALWEDSQPFRQLASLLTPAASPER